MTLESTTYEKIKQAVEEIKNHSDLQPSVGVILGSGLGQIADHVTEATEVPYSKIPHFHGTSIEGHAGKLVVGKFQNVPCVLLQGRFHLYEGYPMSDVVFPTRTICALGIRTLVLTNAAGGINTRFRPKDLMLIEDHINLMGDNPLKGPNLKELGPRFPDMTDAYNKECRSILETTANEIGIELKKGVYAGVLGPTYETPAEIRMLRTVGADAVGMSTVPEAIAANHLGVRVAGISSITNLAAGISPTKLMHDDVVKSGKIAAENLTSLLSAALPKLAGNL